MAHLLHILTDGVIDYLWIASLAAVVLPVLAWTIIKLARLRSGVYRHMLWLYCLVGIVVFPMLWLYGPKLTLVVLPARAAPVEMTAAIETPMVQPVEMALPSGAQQDLPMPSEISVPHKISSQSQPFPLRSLLAGLWLAGVAFMMAKLVLSWYRLRRIWRSAAELAQVESMIAMRTARVRIRTSPQVDSPFCFGIWRPAIVLPGTMHDGNAEQMRMALRHELAHIDRCDCLINLFQRLVEATMFFHPLVWLVSRQVTREREHICDSYVVAEGAAAIDYARLLLHIAERTRRRAPLRGVALFEGGLLSRVRTLLDSKWIGPVRLPRRTALLCAATIAIMLGVFGLVRLEAKSTTTSPADESKSQTTGSVGGESAVEAMAQVRGVVVDEDGTPVNGAKVTSLRLEDAGTETRKDGTFVLDTGRPTLRYVCVLAQADGGQRQGLYEFGSIETVPSKPIQITLKPSTIVNVQVSDSDGKPLSNADIEVFHRYAPVAYARTGANGRAMIHVPGDAQVWWIVAKKSGVGLDYYEGYTSWPLRDQVLALPKNISLVLNGAESVRIQAVDSVGKPVPGVVLLPWTMQTEGKIAYINTSGSKVLRTKTNDRGIAVFDWIPRELTKRMSFVFCGEGFSCPDSPWLAPDAVDATLTAKLLRDTFITGEVVLPDGSPAPNILIQAEGRGETSHYCREYARTGTDGSYAINVYPDQSYIIAIIDDNWAAASRSGVIVREGKPRGGLDLQLVKGTVIWGRVTIGADRQGAADQTITLIQEGHSLPKEFHKNQHEKKEELVRWGRTDQAGRYTFRVGPGSYLLRGPAGSILEGATTKPNNRVGPHETLDISEQREIVRNYHMPRPARGVLTGTVVVMQDPERAVANAVVRGGDENDRVEFTLVADPSGHFTVDRRLDTMLVHARNTEGTLAGWARVGPDDTTVVIQLAPAAVVTGRVVDADNAPVPNLRIRYSMSTTFDKHPKALDGFETRSDEAGHYAILGVTPGSFCNVWFVHDKTPRSVHFPVDRAGSMSLKDVVVGKGSPTSQSGIVWAVSERFTKLYRLEEGEILKRIAPPFTPERQDYYRLQHPGQAEAIPEPPDRFVFHWDGSLRNWGMTFGKDIDFDSVLRRVLGLASYEFSGPKELLEIDLPGDWIVRNEASQKAKLTALEKILKKDLGRSIRFERRQVEREVIIAKGQFKFQPLSDTYNDKWVHMYSDKLDPNEGSGGGTAHSMGKLLRTLGDQVGRWVFDETEGPKTIEIPYGHHHSSYLRRLPEGPDRFAKLDLLLSNMAKQTSLTFRRERRKIDVWIVIEGNNN